MDLILTGREVSGSEAEQMGKCGPQALPSLSLLVHQSGCSFQTGLANRVVPNDQSLQAAVMNLPRLLHFPSNV